MNQGDAVKKGTKVKLVRDVERYPHFIAEAGRTGTVTQADPEQIVVQLDEPVEGSDEWNNEIHWYPDMYDGIDFRDAFNSDVVPVND